MLHVAIRLEPLGERRRTKPSTGCDKTSRQRPADEALTRRKPSVFEMLSSARGRISKKCRKL
jgi:hypothetical protein